MLTSETDGYPDLHARSLLQGFALKAAVRRRLDRSGEDVDRTLRALADPQRRRTVDLLRQRPHTAGELARGLELPAPAMSRHLRVLKQSGLVDESHPEFDARVRIYSLRVQPMAGLRTWLEETEQLWSDQLGAFKAHLEKSR